MNESAKANKEERCIHAIKKVFCTVCITAQKSLTIEVAAADKTASPPREERFVSLHSKGLLDAQAPKDWTHVHFVGFPTLEQVKRILILFPRLRVLNFAPCFKRYIEIETYRALLEERGVKLQFELVCGRGPNPIVTRRRSELEAKAKNLTPEQLEKLNELEWLGFDEATAFKMYFFGEEKISLIDIGKLLGSKRGHGVALRRLHGILVYLDETTPVNKSARKYAAALAKRVAKKMITKSLD